MIRAGAKPAVLCAGRAYCDLVFVGVDQLPELGKEVFSQGLELHAGGGALIAASAFRALGHAASAFSILPADPFLATVEQQMRTVGVDLSQCAKAPKAAAPQVTVAMVSAQDRAFLSHKSGKAIPSNSVPDGDWSHLHIAELRSLVEHPELIVSAREAGMTISLDCGWDGALLGDGAGLSELINLVDVFLPNFVEFESLSKSGYAIENNVLTVVKLGKEGARACVDAGWVSSEGSPVKVVDTTGAGDAFNGGFLSAWLADAPLETCLEQGNICGAIAVQHVGGIGGFEQMERRFSGP